MSRITKIEGDFMGVKFEVKPTPIKFREVEKQRRDMLLDWYKENHPDTHAKLIDEETKPEDYTQEDVEALEAWLLDVEFRAKYLQFMSEASMKLSKPLSEDIWKSDDLEYGTIEEAWDFFTKRQSIPRSGALQR